MSSVDLKKKTVDPKKNALQRLTKELRDNSKNPSVNYTYSVTKDKDGNPDLFKWELIIKGPEKGPNNDVYKISNQYAGRDYVFTITFSDTYPFQAPSVKFIKTSDGTAMNHANITTSMVCVDILKESNKWSPAYTVDTIATSIRSLIAHPDTGGR